MATQQATLEEVKFLTARQLAEFLRVRPQTVYRWGRRGLIPVYRVGRTNRYSKVDVMKYLERREE
jgi:excisionase family DNA binding protein